MGQMVHPTPGPPVATALYVSTIRYAPIFAKKHGTLFWEWYGYGTLVRYASKIELRYGTLVRYGLRCGVRSTQVLNVPYRTAILGHDWGILLQQVLQN